MIPFLSGFLKNLPAIQTKQLLRILSQRRDSGEIRTQDEFVKELSVLANMIGGSKLSQKTPALAFQEGDLIESDAVRTFLDATKMDMEALLGEAENLSNVVRAHHKILTENYFDALEAALDELESDVRAYEVLTTRKFTGFTKRIKSLNFSGSNMAVGASAADPFSSSLFSDLRSGKAPTLSPPRMGELGIHLGILPDHSEYQKLFTKIEIITDSTTPQTALSTDADGNVPDNVIDGNSYTLWQRGILLDSYPPFCRMKLLLSFPVPERISALVVSPVSDVPLKIADISYIDSGGTEHELGVGSMHIATSTAVGAGMTRSDLLSGAPRVDMEDWVVSNRPKTIPLGDLTVSKVILTLQQGTAIPAEFYYYDSDIGGWRTSPVLEELLRERLMGIGGSISEDLGFIGLEGEDTRLGRFVEYRFGLRDVYCLEREYQDTGLFVPEPITIGAPKVLAFFADAEFPTCESSDIEFLLKKENYDSAGSLLDTEVIPFLAYGDSSVDERLFLKSRNKVLTTKGLNDTATTRFYPDFSSSFEVYVGESLLTLGNEYHISVDGGSTWESVVPPVGVTTTPKECRIRFKNPSTSAILRVVYTPLVSGQTEGSEVWLNANRTVRLDKYQTYVFDSARSYGEVSSCKIGLQILVRSNTLNTRVSPYLKEIVILGN
jgi:hypothetical protein